MQLTTLPYENSTSAAVVFDKSMIGFVRSLARRENNINVMSLIESPLSTEELNQLAKSAIPFSVTNTLPPLSPPKNVLCVGKNYVAHAIEGSKAEGLAKADIPSSPVWFTKAHTCLIGNGAEIRPPIGLENCLDYEGELAFVIGTRCRYLTESNALEAVFGYTVFNDITARDIQQERKQWFKGKSSDTFGPIGPWIVTADEVGDPQSLQLKTIVNGEVRQSSNTKNMIFTIRDLLVDLTQGITLEPGDIISTGTPAGVAWGMDKPRYLKPGDHVVVEIERVGRLENVVGTTVSRRATTS